MSFREYTPHYTRIIIQIINERISKIIFLIKIKWWGISVGSGLSMCGIMSIMKAPGSLISIGDRCRILSKFNSNLHGLDRKSMFSTLQANAKLIIGNDCGFSSLVIACSDNISIGDRVMIGANCTITDTDSHSIDFRERSPDYYKLRCKGWTENVKTSPISIEDDVFIGMHCIILKGVTIGKGSVIGAGCIVSKSIPGNVIAAGNPAVPVRKLN
jgi:acetyltransferase-like isoleucine patch superfamily enzyme